MPNVSVVIPVGPDPIYRQLVPDAINSVFEQTVPVKEILILDDQAHIKSPEWYKWFDRFPEYPLVFSGTDSRYNKNLWVYTKPPKEYEIWISKYDTPWRLGFAATFNCGVAMALTDLVLYLAADDTLAPTAVEDCLESYDLNDQKDAWYALTYESPSGGICDIPINAAMVTKGLWRFTGGFPPSAFAGPDALLLSCLMVHAPDRIIKVMPGRVNYHIREHPQQETKRQMGFYAASGVVEIIRNMETQRFVPYPFEVK